MGHAYDPYPKIYLKIGIYFHKVKQSKAALFQYAAKESAAKAVFNWKERKWSHPRWQLL